MRELDQQKINDFLTEQGCDYIVWERNTPYASHMGGVWERMVRSVKEVLTGLMTGLIGKKLLTDPQRARVQIILLFTQVNNVFSIIVTRSKLLTPTTWITVLQQLMLLLLVL